MRKPRGPSSGVSNSWRDVAAPIIAGVIRDAGPCDPRTLRKLISAAYPFGERAYWPYKVWLDEVARQLGSKRPRPADVDPRQGSLL